MAAEQGELVWAAHLWGAAEALREAIGTPIPPVYRLGHERAVVKARAQVGNETFAKGRCRLPFFEAGGKSRQELAKKEGGRR